MSNPIARALGWALMPVLLGLLMLALPPTGRHRTHPTTRAAQRRRRRTLWLATVGVDVDQRDIHAGTAR
ncbi:hypothetical protein EDD98_7070 [Streptomyces sp. PanSC19]|uniref:hypothetical protein n=1 Tax=Streptomyces sp. PanSC19 TaxID=1520455 RepID=UPI000F953096|nr:hypothetical protein [Streptomyces sp. PanSC19]ROQ24462.1 hypothetical protein EDD98_7070 [Streptomyces sp. PanSC19]